MQKIYVLWIIVSIQTLTQIYAVFIQIFDRRNEKPSFNKNKSSWNITNHVSDANTSVSVRNYELKSPQIELNRAGKQKYKQHWCEIVSLVKIKTKFCILKIPLQKQMIL